MLSEMIIKDAESQPQTVKYKIIEGLAGLDDQEEALKDPETAYYFAYYIKRANVERCQDAVCKSPFWAYCFAQDIPGSNIEICQEAACRNPKWARVFARDVIGADKEKCRKACKRTKYAF